MGLVVGLEIGGMLTADKVVRIGCRGKDQSDQSMKNLPTLTGDGGEKPKDQGSNLDVASGPRRFDVAATLVHGRS